MPTIVAVTGHRPGKLGGYDEGNSIAKAVKQQLREELERIRPDSLISGMALGVDQWAVQIALDLAIPVIAAVPCDGQDAIWKPELRRRYAKLLARCTEVHVVCPGGYARWKMQTRNEWMVDHCQQVIAVWDGSDGGTEKCVRYARKVGKPVVEINPRDQFFGR